MVASTVANHSIQETLITNLVRFEVIPTGILSQQGGERITFEYQMQYRFAFDTFRHDGNLAIWELDHEGCLVKQLDHTPSAYSPMTILAKLIRHCGSIILVIVGDLRPSRWAMPTRTLSAPSVDKECGGQHPNRKTTAVPLDIPMYMSFRLGTRIDV